MYWSASEEKGAVSHVGQLCAAHLKLLLSNSASYVWRHLADKLQHISNISVTYIGTIWQSNYKLVQNSCDILWHHLAVKFKTLLKIPMAYCGAIWWSN